MEIDGQNPAEGESQHHPDREERGGELREGLLYDGTLPQPPLLLVNNQTEKENGISNYVPLPHLPTHLLHNSLDENGVWVVDEIVACSEGYICYHLHHSRCFLICHPATKGSEVLVPYDNTFSNCFILAVFMQVRGHRDARLVVIVQKGPEEFTDDLSLFKVYSYTNTDGQWATNGILSRFSDIGNDRLPISCCQIEGEEPIYGLDFNPLIDTFEIWKLGNGSRRWKIQFDDRIYSEGVYAEGIQRRWLKKVFKEEYKQISPALFSYKKELFMMSSFETDDMEEDTRGIGIWRLSHFLSPDKEGYNAEKVVEFPKSLSGFPIEKNYDFVQFKDSFAVFDINYGYGHAYNYATKRFYIFGSCSLHPSFTRLRPCKMQKIPSYSIVLSWSALFKHWLSFCNGHKSRRRRKL